MGRKKKDKRKIDDLPKQYKEFLLDYINLGRNSTKAYLRMKPSAKYTTARTEGSRLLAKPNVKEALQEYYDNLFKNKENEISKIFDKLISITNSDISDFIDENGDIKVENFKDLDTWVISQYDKTISETEKGQNVKQSIKVLDKIRAISELKQILGMVTEKAEISGTIIVKRAIRPKDNDKKNKRKYNKKNKEIKKDEEDILEIKLAQRPTDIIE